MPDLLQAEPTQYPLEHLLTMKPSLRHYSALAALVGLFSAASLLAASASENYENHCSKCHGADGKGQTKMGKKLNVRDMTTEQYKKEYDQGKALASIKDGIKKDGKEIKKSYASDLSEAEMKALVEYVKGLK